MARKTKLEKEELLWKDRKRFLGLPLSFTRYQFSNERLVLRSGFLKTVTDEIMVYRIMDIRSVQTLGQKLFGVGTVTLISTDKTLPTLELKNIKRPDEIRRFLSNLIEQQRVSRGIAASELLGTGRISNDAGHTHGHDHGHSHNHDPNNNANHAHNNISSLTP